MGFIGIHVTSYLSNPTARVEGSSDRWSIVLGHENSSEELHLTGFTRDGLTKLAETLVATIQSMPREVAHVV